MVIELPRQIRWNSYFEVPIYTSYFPPHKAGNCSQKYYVLASIENQWYNLLFQIHAALKPRKVSKIRHFQTQQSFTQHALCCRARDLDSRSDSFHSTSENSENLSQWFWLHGKRPWSQIIHVTVVTVSNCRCFLLEITQLAQRRICFTSLFVNG